MIFLIEYDRSKGNIVRFEQFQNTKRLAAEKLRLNIELDLSKKSIDHEVVLLDAVNENALKKTHRRYFENINEIGKIN